jgi:hypothetical protein
MTSALLNRLGDAFTGKRQVADAHADRVADGAGDGSPV